MPTDKLQQAIGLIKSGDKKGGQNLLIDIVNSDPENEKAWLWLVSVISQDKRAFCLEKVLSINPNNLQAKRYLEKIRVGGQPQLNSASKANIAGKKSTQSIVEHPISINKFISLIAISIASALILAGINNLLFSSIPEGDGGMGVLYVIFVLPLTPLFSLPATAIVYFIHRWFHKDFFYVARIGIPFLFNLLGASALPLSFWSPVLSNRVQHPPANVKLTGVHSDKIGMWDDQKSLDVLIGVNSGRSGEFTVGAQLTSGDQIISTTTEWVSLVPGDNTVTLQFHGDDIRLYQLDGPYQVQVIVITDQDTLDYFERHSKPWQTAAYHWRDFGDELCYSLTIHMYPIPSAGTIKFSPPPNCPDGGYLHGTYVTVKAIPNPGYQFKGWRIETPQINSDSSVFTKKLIRDMEADAFFELQP